jgi:signal transduction histidine kinase
MSLKNRLRLTILLPLMALAIGYTLLSLVTVAEVLFREASERAALLASQVQTLLVQRVTEYSRTRPAEGDLATTEQAWAAMASEDLALSKMLEQTMASTRTVVEIDIRGQDSRIVASSNPNSIGKPARAAMPISEWQDLGKARQIWRVMTHQEEYQAILPLGLQGRAKPLFEVRVLVSSVLLRNTLEPEVRNLVVGLGVYLMLAFALAVLTSQLVLLPIQRLSEAIDKVSRGEALVSNELVREAQEVQAVESKLSLLGAQVRDAKEDLKQMQSSVHQLLERMEDGVLLFDSTQRVVNAGRAAEKVLGRGRWELTNAPLEELFPVGTATGDLLQSAMSLKQGFNNAPVALGGKRILLDLEVLEDFPKRDTKGYLLTMRDADAKLSISKQLDVSQRLSALNRLTSGVAHEIKNPLNSIGLHLEILKERVAGNDPQAAEELRILRDETRRLDRVVKTFLDFTKPVELKLAPLDLFELLNGLMQFLMPEAQKNKVKLGIECESYPAMIRGDADLLKQAFLNLMRNGMEAMPDGGDLKVTVTREPEDFRVEIRDTGTGIPESSRAKIFQLYFTTKQQGTGIGLAITYRVAQLHNGSITFRSEPGQGTTFELRFPALMEG